MSELKCLDSLFHSKFDKAIDPPWCPSRPHSSPTVADEKGSVDSVATVLIDTQCFAPQHWN